MPKNKTLYTFFFGYSSFKWRRLIRTILILISIVWLGLVLYAGIYDMFFSTSTYRKDNAIFWFNMFLLPTLGYFILIGLISWLVKPFVVEEG